MLRKIGEQQNTSSAVGSESSRALIGYRKDGGKSSADGLQMRLRAARSPPRKSAGAARRPSRGASFFELAPRARTFESSREKFGLD